MSVLELENKTLKSTTRSMATTPIPYWRGSSFPYSQYKDHIPEDQFAKLIAMHENSAANAAIYVAVVLAVYIILLSLLMCRYMKRRPSIRELPLPFPLPQDPSSVSQQFRHERSSTVLDQVIELLNTPCSSLRHCTIRGGAGVASISSDDNEDPDNPLQGSGRRDSIVIKMNRMDPLDASQKCQQGAPGFMAPTEDSVL